MHGNREMAWDSKNSFGHEQVRFIPLKAVYLLFTSYTGWGIYAVRTTKEDEEVAAVLRLLSELEIRGVRETPSRPLPPNYLFVMISPP